MIPDWAVRTKADKLAIDAGYTWDESKASAICKFANKLFKPQYIAGQFTLLPWQERFLKSLYGWVDVKGNRRWKLANLHVPKKQGKTLLVSLVSAYELLAAGEPSAFVVTGSVSTSNAAQVFAELQNTVNKAGLKKYCNITPHLKRITVPSLNSQYLSLSSDGDRCQGFNCSLITIDEAHAHKTVNLYDSLKYAHVARNNGLMIVISTAGDDPTHWYNHLYNKSKKILSGEDTDITHYAEVYESDPDSDPESPEQWSKSNPSLGTSFSLESFRNDMLASRDSPTDWLRFQRYRLNRWTRSDDLAFFDVNDWDRNSQEQPDTTDCPVTLGVDLSLTTDPSAITACWELPDGSYFVRGWAWVARAGVLSKEKTTLPKYEELATDSDFVITDGDMIDHELILQFLIDFCKDNNVRKVIFDPTSAIVMMNRLENETGVEVRRMPTTFRYMNAPMRHLLQQIKAKKVKHNGGNWLRWCLSNVRCEENKAGEIRPSVKRSTDHIDGAIALIMSYSDIVDVDTTTTGTGIGWLKSEVETK
ncbi:MAG: hypothetical protein C0467_14120 [Planctomycetaceae bacterium]|nr:hypothetical protein [Planctomycetaceae bacterium]